LGGVLVGGGYTRLRAHAQRVGIGIVAPPPALPRTAETGLVLGDTLLLASQWADSPLNPLQGRERALAPPRLLPAAIDAASLPDAEAWRDLSSLALDIPLAAHLAAQGWSAQAGIVSPRFIPSVRWMPCGVMPYAVLAHRMWM